MTDDGIIKDMEEMEESVEDLWRRHHPGHHDEAKAIVTGPHGYPQAIAVETFEGWAIKEQNDKSMVFLSELVGSEPLAWESALFELTQLNAWLLWKAAGEPEGEALENWLDAQGNLENKPSPPTPPPTE